MNASRQGLVRSIAVAVLLSATAVACSTSRYTLLRDDQLPSLASCRAEVVEKEPCAAHLRTTDGRRLWVGGPGASPDVAGFVQFLEVGRVYALPEAFVAYQQHLRRSGEPRPD